MSNAKKAYCLDKVEKYGNVASETNIGKVNTHWDLIKEALDGLTDGQKLLNFGIFLGERLQCQCFQDDVCLLSLIPELCYFFHFDFLETILNKQTMRR